MAFQLKIFAEREKIENLIRGRLEPELVPPIGLGWETVPNVLRMLPSLDFEIAQPWLAWKICHHISYLLHCSTEERDATGPCHKRFGCLNGRPIKPLKIAEVAGKHSFQIYALLSFFEDTISNDKKECLLGSSLMYEKWKLIIMVTFEHFFTAMTRPRKENSPTEKASLT